VVGLAGAAVLMLLCSEAHRRCPDEQEAAAPADHHATRHPGRRDRHKTDPTVRPQLSGACVPIASDVDCAGGGGNGPAYVQGPVRVVGTDIYDLDRDVDGIGCD